MERPWARSAPAMSWARSRSCDSSDGWRPFASRPHPGRHGERRRPPGDRGGDARDRPTTAVDHGRARAGDRGAAGGLTMAGDVSKGPPDTDRMDVERVLSRREPGVTLLGRDEESGATWVIKEVHGPVREFPPADRRRSVWTRLVLPWGVEREDARIEDRPSVHRGHDRSRTFRSRRPFRSRRVSPWRSTRSERSMPSTVWGSSTGP